MARSTERYVCDGCGFTFSFRKNDKWIQCPQCGLVTHLKIKKNGKVKKIYHV